MKIFGIRSFAASAVRRLPAWALAVAVPLSALAVAADASERVALVVGNAEYEHVRDLANPMKDAADVGAALGRLGFEVTRLENAGYRDLLRGLQKFEAAAARAEIAVVFYAGHGIEVDKRNYLVPVEARLEADSDVKYEAVPLDVVMAAVEVASTLGLVILDACRDNPFLAMMRSTGLARSVDRGLARVEPRGTGKSILVAYSAKEGTTAADGEPGGNSPYVSALLKHLERPDLHVGDLFIEVRKEMLATPGRQTPVEHGALVEKVFLASRAALPPAATAKAAEIVLADGLTLADWALLAEDRLKAGDHARLLEEAAAHLREHGPVKSVEAIRERAASELLGRSFSADRRESSVGWTDLHYAAALDMPGAVAALCDAGMAADARLKSGAAPISDGLKGALATLGHNFEGWTASGETPLMIAAGVNASNAAAALIDCGADLEATTEDHGSTPLHQAALNDAAETAELLIDRGADLEATTEDHGSTPLHQAALNDAAEAAATLIDRGADVNATDGDDWTPLHQAALNDAAEAAMLLIDRGADVNATDGDASTPLHVAAYRDAAGTAALLIDRGADLEATTEDHGFTPLHVAALNDAAEAAALLLDRGADLNATMDDGHTPLGVAIQHEAYETQAVLRRHGGNAASPEETEKGLALSREERRLIQMGLASLGHDPGPADGVFGRRTRAALRAWQGSVGWDVTGYLTREQLEAFVEAARLRTEAEAAASRRFSELLGRPFSPDRREGSVGWTDLHYAAALDLPGAVAALCDAGMTADARLETGAAPFGDGLKRTLAALGHEHFEDWNANGETPLMIASNVNARNAAAALIDCGAGVNVANGNGSTPLHYTADKDTAEVAALLIERGADLEATDRDGGTPLHYAALFDASEVAELLIERGADVNATNDHGAAPLHYAADRDAAAAAKLLIERGADVKKMSDGDRTPLHTAALYDAVEAAELLIEHGADVNATMDDGRTPLHAAAYRDAVEAAELLIEHGADVNATMDEGWTPLHAAVLYDAVEAAELLIDRGADVNATGFNGNTPLHSAAASDDSEVAALLIKRGADVNATNDHGSTPLHAAALYDAVEAAELLIDRGSDVNATGDNGNTPLHYAAASDASEIAALLIKRGVDVNATMDDGHTPLDVANQNEAYETQAVLRRHGGTCGRMC